MRKSKFPKRIENMIRTGWNYGLSAKTIARKINSSSTAKRLNVEYKPSQIAGKLSHLTKSI